MNYSLRELYDLLRSKDFLSYGTRGIVLVNDDNSLIKVPKDLSTYKSSYNDFVDSYNYIKLKRYDLEKYEKNQKVFMKNNCFDFIDFALNIVYLDNLYVGVLLKWYKDYKNLLNYNYKDDKELLNLFKRVIDYNRILIDSGIYHMDLLPRNILYDGERVRIIDIDGPAINYNKVYNCKEEDGSYYTIFIGLYSVLLEMFKNDDDFIDRKEEYIELTSMDRYKKFNYDKSRELIHVIENRGIFTR